MKVYEKFIDDSLSKKPDTPRVKIAILDTGIDMDHQDVEARCEHIKGKYDWTSERPNRVIDQHGHGTHTANLVMDYAPDAELYVAKIARTKPADPRTIAKVCFPFGFNLPSLNSIQAINWAVKMKVDIISMSFGFPTKEIDGYSELEQTIQDAYSKGVLLFAAASNDGANKGVSYPARDRHVFGVYSTDANGNRSSFSPTARTNTVNFATIGEAVESAWPDYLVNDDDEDENAEDGARKHKSGTSFATPIAVGIAAFVLMYGRLNLKAEDIERLKRYAGMNAVLQKVAETSDGSRDRNGYFYLALNRYDDKLFGSEDEDYIKRTIVHTLHNS